MNNTFFSIDSHIINTFVQPLIYYWKVLGSILVPWTFLIPDSRMINSFLENDKYMEGSLMYSGVFISAWKVLEVSWRYDQHVHEYSISRFPYQIPDNVLFWFQIHVYLTLSWRLWWTLGKFLELSSKFLNFFDSDSLMINTFLRLWLTLGGACGDILESLINTWGVTDIYWKYDYHFPEVFRLLDSGMDNTFQDGLITNIYTNT